MNILSYLTYFFFSLIVLYLPSISSLIHVALNSITDIPGYGNMSAVTMCERLDIKSCKDTEKLKKAKEEVYLKGFYEGIMLVGECVGMKVCDAKPLIRKTLMDKGEALVYFEPETLVMSRTGDEVRIRVLSFNAEFSRSLFFLI